MPSEGNSSPDPLGELKRKNIEDIQGDENTKGRKPEEEKEGNEQTTGISLKTLRMQRCRAKRKAERGDKYDELKQRDAERNRKNRELASQQRKGDKRATDNHRKKECKRN
jgi:hypothetical protein